MVVLPTAKNTTNSWIVLALLICGYSFYSVLKKSFSSLQVFISQQYHFTKADIGLISSTFSITYGFSKFLGGVLSDIFPWQDLFCLGLLLASISNIAVSYCLSIESFCIIWGMNGLLQGFGWPSIALFVMTQFDDHLRGTIWSITNFGSNIGYMVAPFILIPLATQSSWNISLQIIGVLGVILSAFIYCILYLLGMTRATPHIAYHPSSASKPIRVLSIKSISTALSSMPLPVAFLLASNLFTYLILKGMADWTGYYLIEDMNLSASSASKLMLVNEGGGLLGSLLCGAIVDSSHTRPAAICLIVSIALLIATAIIPHLRDSHGILLEVCLFIIGFAINVPKTLLSLCLRESTSLEVGGTIEGLFGLLGQLGASIAGYGIGYAIDKLGGWRSLTTIQTVAAMSLAISLISPWLDSCKEKIVAVNRRRSNKKKK